MNKNIIFSNGATPLEDYSELILPWVQNLQDLNRAETESISQAYRKYLHGKIENSEIWFNIKFLLKIHFDMFSSVWKWAGKYRKSITSIGVIPYLIPSHLASLCSEVVAWNHEKISLNYIEQAARIHHRLVWIHPFENGNGRFSRLVSDRFLLSKNYFHPMWPSDLYQKGEERTLYIQSLKKADLGDFTELEYLIKTWGAQEK